MNAPLKSKIGRQDAVAVSAAGSFIEVLRVAAAHVDEAFGSWYWAARGSGVWLAIGDEGLLTVNGPADLAAVGVSPELLNRSGPALMLTRALRSLRRKDGRAQFGTIYFPKGSQASWIRNQRGEIIDLRAVGLAPSRHIRASDQLKSFYLSPLRAHEKRTAQQDTPFVAKACVTPSRGPGQHYRAGWRASLPCTCQGDKAVLNCGGKLPPFGARELNSTEVALLGRNRYASTWLLRAKDTGTWRKTVVRHCGAAAWDAVLDELVALPAH